MSRSGEVMAQAERELQGVRGWLASLLTLRRGPSGREVRARAAQLRRAADTLEEMLR